VHLPSLRRRCAAADAAQVRVPMPGKSVYVNLPFLWSCLTLTLGVLPSRVLKTCFVAACSSIGGVGAFSLLTRSLSHVVQMDMHRYYTGNDGA
jgi:hypothetical protein